MYKDEGAGRKKEVRRIKGGEYQDLEAARNQMQVHDDGEGRDADDGAAAAAERHHRQFGVKPLRLYLIIPKSMTETALRKQFEQFGAIEYVSVVKDKVSGTSRGFGYVKFFQFSHGAKAFAGCNPNYKPKFADPRPRWVEHRAHDGGSIETRLADLRTKGQRKRSCGEVLGRSRSSRYLDETDGAGDLDGEGRGREVQGHDIVVGMNKAEGAGHQHSR